MRVRLQLVACLLFVAAGPYLYSQVTPPADSREPVRLSIDDCLAIGLENNPQVRVAEAGVKAAQAQTMQARANLYPSLNLTANAVHSNQLGNFAMGDPTLIPTTTPSDGNGNLVPGLPAHIHYMPFPSFEISSDREGDVYGVKVEGTYALYTGDKIKNGVKASELNEEVARENVRQERIQLIYNIEQTFYGVLMAQEMVKVVDEGYGTVAAHLKQVKAYYNEGMVSNLDVTQVEARLADLEPQRIQARNGVIMARLGLNNQLNIDLETVVEARGEFSYEPHQLPLPEDLYATAMANRPEMRIMRLRREMAKRNYDIQLANAYPTVALFANYSWNRGQDMPPNDKIWRDGYQAGVAVTAPLFDGRGTEGKVAEAQAMIEQVERGTEALDLGIRTQVRQALLSLKAGEEQVKAQDANVAAAQKAFDVAKARYGVGLATNLDVMDAQTQLTSVRAQRLQAVYEYNLAWMQLQAAIGMPDEELAK